MARPRVLRPELMKAIYSSIPAAVLLVGIWLPSSANGARALQPCAPIASHFSSGFVPHTTIPLYTDARNRWHPIATDGVHVLMARETSREPNRGGAVRLSTVTLPSSRLIPVPRGAYPSHTSLEGWQLEWPWIAGIAFTAPLPVIPANWRLWAGNVVTGKHFILDSYRYHRHPVPEFFPHFALDGGRVAWEFSTDRPARFDNFSSQRIALEDLRSRRRSLLTPPDPAAIYERITMSGSRIVWESRRFDATGKSRPVDLSMYDLRSHRPVQLSHNRSPLSSSLYPRLSGNYLLFERGPVGSDYGTPFLVDLTSRRGIGRERWFSQYHFWWLGKVGLTNTQMGNGLISWDDRRILDVTRGKVWSFRNWSVDEMAGRTAVVERMDLAHAHVSYAAWRFPADCSVAGFSSG